jgi:hypothetical protein
MKLVCALDGGAPPDDGPAVRDVPPQPAVTATQTAAVAAMSRRLVNRRSFMRHLFGDVRQ